MQTRNYTKIFGIAGVILGEAYMLYTALAPRRTGELVPVQHTIWVIITLSIFFGAFGGLVGTGIGLAVSALFGRKPAPPAESKSEPQPPPPPK